MSSVAGPLPRARRLPGFVNIVGALVLLVIVVSIALHAENAQPPSIAEFAPQAQQIKEAPQEQTAVVGRGGGAAIGAAAPSPQAAASPPSDAIFLRCVGDPPRQIEDPQSPPCVPYWAGRNGGATSTGVTDAAIAIAWVNQVQGTSTLYQPYFQAIANFFNSRFELYRRRFVLHAPPYQYPNDISPPAQRALADQVAADHNFGATEFPNQGGYVYHKELADKGVVSVFGFEGNTPEPDLAASNPYLWSYELASDNMLRSIAGWYCGELAGKTPAHAGTLGVDMTRPRRLGVIWDPAGPLELPPPQSFLDQLSACQGSRVNYVDDSAENDSATIVNLVGDHDSSVLCLCRYIYWDGLTYYATDDRYQPEWLLNSYGGGDTFETFHFDPPEPSQAQHVFGLSYQPKQENLAQNPVWWAISEGDPALTPPASSGIYLITHFYRSMLLLASGVQMAGADLTPAAFGQHLHGTVFPDPDTPIFAGHVDLLGGSHAFTVDATEWWYDPTAQSPFAAEGDGRGAICYVAHGQRHDPFTWRGAADDFYQGACDSGA